MKTSEPNGFPVIDTPPAMNRRLEPASGDDPSSPPRLGRWALIITILVIAATIFGLVPRWTHRRELVQESHETAIPTVNVVRALPGNTSSALTLPAELKPAVEAPIYARASGFVKRRFVDIGSTVEAGAVLADIDTPELDQETQSARAGLVRARSALELSKTTAARWVDLLKTASVSEQEAAERQADLALKNAEVTAAEANLRRLENLLAFAHVTAPFAGTITSRNIDMGDLITSGKELFRLADVRTLRVFVHVPQPAAPGIKTGLVAELTVPELASRKFPAKVVRTAGAVDPNSRTLLTEAEVDNSNGALLAGSYAQISFPDMKENPALVLPSQTLLFRAEGSQVGVVRPDGRVELRNVVIGRDYGRTIEVLSGIAASDRVIANPPDSLTSGITVRVLEDEAKEKRP